MTTPRIRRTKPQQARDILLALLKDQEAEAAKHKVAYEGANLRATTTRRVIELLDQAMLPGMERELLDTPALLERREFFSDAAHRINIGPAPLAPPSLDAKVPAPLHSEEGGAPPEPRRYRQRIGERAALERHIDDVWSAAPGAVNERVHSTLMYARQDLCEWCKAGVPFATEKRAEHYAVTKDAAGVERGFSYEPCKGAA